MEIINDQILNTALTAKSMSFSSKNGKVKAVFTSKQGKAKEAIL